MFRCAMVVLPDAFLASVGAMVDSCSLVRERFRDLAIEPEKSKSASEMTLTVMSIDGGPVRIGGGIDYTVDRAIDAGDRFDFVWLPSFRIGRVDAMRQRLATMQPLIRWLQAQAAAGTMIGASGAAVLLLVAARLLDGMRVPVSRVFLPTVRALYPHCHTDDKRAFANYGTVLLSKGIGVDFTVIAQAMGQTVSPSSGRWVAEVTATVDAESRRLSSDPLVASAQLWIEQLYATDLTIAQLAARLSTSQPTLVRRFRQALGITPKVYVQEMRMRFARGMLAGSNRTIEEIAGFVGYSDVRVFRRAFRNFTGKSAAAWRRSRQHLDRNYPQIED